MAKCMYCHHCGKCGPGSLADTALHPGMCPFCRTQNSPDARECASCGKPLPQRPGKKS